MHLIYTRFYDPVAGSKKIATVYLSDQVFYDFKERDDGIHYDPYPEGKHHYSLVRTAPNEGWDFTLEHTRSRYHFAYDSSHDHDGSIESMTDDYGNSIVFDYKDLAIGKLYV